MRWFILFLVLVNIALFSWHQFFISNAGQVTKASALYTIESEDVEPFQLISEMTELQRANLLKVKDSNRGATEREPQCWIVGPFANKAMGFRFLREVSSYNVQGSLKSVTFPGEKIHIVHLPPEESEAKAAAILKDLHSQGRESFLMTQGALKNAISVGVFASKEEAALILNEYKSAGYEAKVVEQARMVSEIWASFSTGEYNKISENRWVSLLSSYKNVEKQQNFCDVIASYPNID